jgi:protein-L-isoaspartate(D-aspartate) O-methyltransferase
MTSEFENRARDMVELQLRQRGVRNKHVLEAMRQVPRHEFVPPDLVGAAYEDRPLPIGEHETISQPYIVAVITDATHVARGDRALEIGSGTGYQAAILAQLGASVCAVERNPRLAEESRGRLARLGYTNVEVFSGDGSDGLAERAPFDVIVLSAGTPAVSPTLLGQLAEGGWLVAPVGSLQQQELLVLHRQGGKITTESAGACQFVPLIGKGGWSQNETK